MIMSSCDFKLHSAGLSRSHQNPCTAGYNPLLYKKFGIWVVLYTSTMNIYFPELSVYTEAMINAISPSSSTFSTIILTVSSILVQQKFVDRVIEAISVHPECSEDQKYEGTSLHIKFSKSYPFSNPFNDSTVTGHGNSKRTPVLLTHTF